MDASAARAVVLELHSVSKRFRYELRTKQSLRRSAANLFGRNADARLPALEALAEVNLRLRRYEALAMVGRNGSGKSTLVRLIAGIYSPSAGRIARNGRIAPVLSLGLGFHPELSGADNMTTFAAVVGLSRRHFAESFDEMVAFSGIGEALHRPVKHYSTGMQARIALSVALYAEASVLVLDEVLSVGDQDFRTKVVERLRDYHRRGGSSIIVSHDLDVLRSLCSRGIWLEQGRVVQDGDVDTVLTAYENSR